MDTIKTFLSRAPITLTIHVHVHQTWIVILKVFSCVYTSLHFLFLYCSWSFFSFTFSLVWVHHSVCAIFPECHPCSCPSSEISVYFAVLQYFGTSTLLFFFFWLNFFQTAIWLTLTFEWLTFPESWIVTYWTYLTSAATTLFSLSAKGSTPF